MSDPDVSLLFEMEICNLNVGAEGARSLVLDDEDRFALIEECFRKHLKWLVLAWAIMRTHLHVVAEGPPAHVVRWLTEAMHAYVYRFNQRHDGDAILRGPVDLRVITNAYELGRGIEYVHDQPIKGARPIVPQSIEYEWSSLREYQGLSAAGIANIDRGRLLMSPHASRFLFAPWRPDLSDLIPRKVPTVTPETILTATAQALMLSRAKIVGGGKTPELAAARALYVRVARLEGYDQCQVGPAIDRSQPRISTLERAPTDDSIVRIVRTLFDDPRLRRRLQSPVALANE